MDKVINLGIPHVAEQIFKGFGLEELREFRKVSETWKILTEEILLFRRWEGKVHLAFTIGKLEVIKVLIKRTDLGQINFNAILNGKTPLILACQHGHYGIVKLLLDYSDSKPIDFNAKDDQGKTALNWACQNRYRDVVDLLLEHSSKIKKEIDVNAKGLLDHRWETVSEKKRNLLRKAFILKA